MMMGERDDAGCAIDDSFPAAATPAGKLPVGIVYALCALAVSLIGLTIAGYLYTNKVGTDSVRRFCGIIVISDNVYRANPPQSEIGRQLAAEFHKLRQRCPEAKR